MWAAVVVVGASVIGGLGRTDVERFYALYEPHWTRLTAHLSRNVKAAGTVSYWDGETAPGKPSGTITFSVVASDTVLVRRTTITRLKDGQVTHTVTLVTPDSAVQYEQSAGQAGWRMGEMWVPWRSSSDAWMYHTGRGVWPPTSFVYSDYIGRGPNAYWRASAPSSPEPFEARRGWYNGTEVTEVRNWSLPSDVDHVTRLDSTDGRVLMAERPARLTTLPKVVRQVQEYSYSPAAAGELPFPAGVRSRYVEPDGKETFDFDVTFTEYQRYTPTAAELDLNKLIGEWPPDPGPRPPLPPPGTYLPEPEPVVVELPAARPPRRPRTAPMSARERYLRAAGLGAFMVAAGLVAVWWRR